MEVKDKGEALAAEVSSKAGGEGLSTAEKAIDKKQDEAEDKLKEEAEEKAKETVEEKVKEKAKEKVEEKAKEKAKEAVKDVNDVGSQPPTPGVKVRKTRSSCIYHSNSNSNSNGCSYKCSSTGRKCYRHSPRSSLKLRSTSCKWSWSWTTSCWRNDR
jgi:membrane protein involved in colicin uptake